MIRKLALTLPLFLLGACSGEEACEAGAYQCSEDGVYLEECVDGAWTEAEDCASQGLECHAEMGHCMTMTDTMSTMTGM